MKPRQRQVYGLLRRFHTVHLFLSAGPKAFDGMPPALMYGTILIAHSGDLKLGYGHNAFRYSSHPSRCR